MFGTDTACRNPPPPARTRHLRHCAGFGRRTHEACSIFLPLPPGCWGDDAPTVEVKVLKAMVTELPTVNYQEIRANETPGRAFGG